MKNTKNCKKTLVAKQIGDFTKSIEDFSKISKVIKKEAFYPFKTSEQALENLSLTADKKASSDLIEFLKNKLPVSKKDPPSLATQEAELSKEYIFKKNKG